LLLQFGHRPSGTFASGRREVPARSAGRWFQPADHLDLFVIAECTGDHTYDKYNQPLYAAWAGIQYLLFKNGPVASSLFETGDSGTRLDAPGTRAFA